MRKYNTLYTRKLSVHVLPPESLLEIFLYLCILQALLAVLPPINSLKVFLSNLYPANNAKFNNIHLKYTCMGICSPNIQFIPTKSSLSGHRAYKCIKYTLHAGNKCRSINSYGYIKAIPT